MTLSIANFLVSCYCSKLDYPNLPNESSFMTAGLPDNAENTKSKELIDDITRDAIDSLGQSQYNTGPYLKIGPSGPRMTLNGSVGGKSGYDCV